MSDEMVDLSHVKYCLNRPTSSVGAAKVVKNLKKNGIKAFVVDIFETPKKMETSLVCVLHPNDLSAIKAEFDKF